MNTALQNKKNSSFERKESRKKKFYRIGALILAVLMVGGGLISVIYSLIFGVGSVVNAAEPKYDGDMQISVGLMYNTDVTVGFETTTTNGFIIGSQNLEGQTKPFSPLWETDLKKVSVTSDANLSKSGMTYSITSSADKTVIGGYHIEIDRDIASKSEVLQIIENSETALANFGLYAFPVFVNGSFRVRVGQFSSSESAMNSLNKVSSVFSSETLSVVSPSKTAVSVVSPDTDKIIFEYDSGSTSVVLGMKPVSSGAETAYIKTPAANLYDGVFSYKRYIYEGTDGVSVINVLPLEKYVAGVLPYEISNSWAMEVQKAFAVTVRSYTIANLKRHSYSFDFDICNSQHCQVYKGVNRINETVEKAVEATKGQVLTYNGKVASTYYSSSTGGVTVSSKEAWGGDDEPYLVAVETPWENYMSHSNGFWIAEVSPAKLWEYLKETKGYSELSGEIKSVSVEQCAENSTYVYKLRVTDTNGNSILIQNTDKVRSTLGAYLKSANFVVGKGSVSYTEKVVIDNVQDVDVVSDTGNADLSDGYSVITNEGEKESSDGEGMSIISSDGTVSYDTYSDGVSVITAQNASDFSGDVTSDTQAETEPEWKTETVSGNEETDEVVTKVAYASSGDNFIFVGKGWGHGVGMSQYGAKDLALLGYSFDKILNSYFPKTVISLYTVLE